MIQKRPTFAPKPIGLSSESAPFSPFCKYPLPFQFLVSVSLFYFVRKSKHFCNVILCCDLCALLAKRLLFAPCVPPLFSLVQEVNVKIRNLYYVIYYLSLVRIQKIDLVYKRKNIILVSTISATPFYNAY